MFQSNMSKNTVDGNCMTKTMLIVMLTQSQQKENTFIPMNKKKVDKKFFFLYLTGFEPATSGFLFSSLLCV